MEYCSQRERVGRSKNLHLKVIALQIKLKEVKKRVSYDEIHSII